MKRIIYHLYKRRLAPQNIRRFQIQLFFLAVALTVVNLIVANKNGLIAPKTPKTPVAIPPASFAETEEALRVVKETLREFHVDADRVRQKDRTFMVPIAKEMRFIDFYLRLDERLRQIDGRIDRAIDDQKNNRYELVILMDQKLAAQFYLMRRASLPAKVGKVAIIVDDFGYRYDEVVNQFICFPLPLTLAILPGLSQSRRIAQEAHLAGREILLHMPMEPLHEKVTDDGYIILANQDAGTIRLRLQQAFTFLPEAIGLNNHQGSKIIADPKIMKVILAEIKRQNKIFIDSYTNPKTIGLSLARSMGVPSAANQVFIDAKDDAAFIEAQLDRLAEIAYKQGKALGIAHVRKRTLQVLQRKLPELNARGIECVSVSAIL